MLINCPECGKEMQIKIKKGYDIYSGETETQIAVCKDCKITREITAKQNNVTITDVLEKFNATDTPNETHKSSDGYCPKCGMKMRTQSKKEGCSAIHGYSYRVYNICDECSIIEDLGVVNETDVKKATHNKIAIREEKPSKKIKKLIKNRPLSIENYLGMFLSIGCICTLFMPYFEASDINESIKISLFNSIFVLPAILCLLLCLVSIYYFATNNHRDAMGAAIIMLIEIMYVWFKFTVMSQDFIQEYKTTQCGLSTGAYLHLIFMAGLLVCGFALKNSNMQYVKQNNND